jgi:hypothetical protein
VPEKRGEIGWLGIGIADRDEASAHGRGRSHELSKNAQFAGLIFQTLWD